MGNPLRGEADLKTATANYTIVLDVNAFCEIEQDTGLSVNELIAEMQGSPSFGLLRSLFAAALQAKHPGTTVREAGDIMSDAGLEAMTEALRTAIKQAMPPATDDAGKKPVSRGARAR